MKYNSIEIRIGNDGTEDNLGEVFEKMGENQRLDREKDSLENVKYSPFRYLKVFNDQCKMNYKNKKEYYERLQKRQQKDRQQTNNNNLAETLNYDESNFRGIKGVERVQQKKLDLIQEQNQKNIGQVVRVEITKSDFTKLDILATNQSEVYTINLLNPLDIEIFDFISWNKKYIHMKYSSIL